MIARGNATDIGDDPVLREVLTCHRINAMPNAGGMNDQPWDFVLWLYKLHEYIDEHEANQAKRNA